MAIVCMRGKRPGKKKKPDLLLVSQPTSHYHRANSAIHLSVITQKPEKRDAYISVWGPMKDDPRFIVCICCGKARPPFGRPPKREPAPQKYDQPPLFVIEG